MTVTPIQARCQHCGGDFHLFEVVDARTGLCPRCGWRLTEDWTAALLDDAARADIAQRHLVAALRNLCNLPGTMTLLPSSVLRNIMNEVGWNVDLDEHPGMLADERERLRVLAGPWATPDARHATRRPRRRRHWFRGPRREPRELVQRPSGTRFAATGRASARSASDAPIP
jgi:hypothetical protein